MKRGQRSPTKSPKKPRESIEEQVDNNPKAHHIKVETDSLKKVTVFEDRAELKREFTVVLSPGLNEVVIERVSGSLIDDSVRVTGKGAAVIEEVQVANRCVTKGTGHSERAKKLRAEQVELEKKKSQLDNQKTSLTKRIEAWDSMIGQVGSGIAAPKDGKFSADRTTLDSVTTLFDFYDKQVTELREKLTLCETKYKAAKEEIYVKKIELSNIDHGETIKVISILLDSTKGGEVVLELTYQVRNASCVPFYDVRVDTKEEKTGMQLSYFANVTQRTGEDWEGASLTLSTARPSLGGDIPDLNTLDAVFYRPPPKNPPPKREFFGFGDEEEGEYYDDLDDDDLPDGPTLKNREATVSKQTLSTEFAITRPCSIPSDGADHKVTIGIVTFEPKLVHVSVPSKASRAFLTASAINSSPIPLLNGNASIYLDGAFVAKTKIKAASPGEKFTASLGVDPSVKIEYIPAHRYKEQSGGMFKILSTTITEQKIVVRNTSNEAVLLTVREQIPRSTDEKIKVKMISPEEVEKMQDECQVNEDPTPKEGARLLSSNILEWTVKLDKGTSQTLLVNSCHGQGSSRNWGSVGTVGYQFSGATVSISYRFLTHVANRRVTKGTGDSERAKKLSSIEFFTAEQVALEKKKSQLDNEKTSLTKRIEALDTMIGQVGSGIAAPKDGRFSADRTTLENVTTFFDFYDEQVTELREKLTVSETSYREAKEEIDVKKRELREIDHGEKSIKVITILLESTKGGEVLLELTYQVSHASWKSFYDVRVDTKERKKEMRLSYFANVSQRTGEDWEGAALTLSTARPSLGGEIPDLDTLDAVFYRPPPKRASRRSFRRRSRSRDRTMPDGDSSECEDYDDYAGTEGTIKSREAGINKQTLSTEFAITRPCSIPSDGADHKVTIGIVTFEPKLLLVSVPSKNASAFLTASSINSSPLPLLNGNASIYLDGTFVAKTKFKAASPGERFTVSLGVDPAVKIEYIPAYKYKEQSGRMFNILSTTVTEQKIVVRNTSGDGVLLAVREQIPRSTDEKIKVKMIFPEGVEKVDGEREMNEDPTPKEGARLLPSNNLEWTVRLDKGTSQTLLVKYAIEHPSTEKVDLIERKY